MSKNIFNSISARRPKSNWFNLSHSNTLSFEMGKLIPVLVEEVLPGDKWRISTESLHRLAPLVAPVMHPLSVDIHYFFVPNRIAWKNWPDFISNRTADAMPPAFPVMLDLPGNTNTIGSLADYLGVPVDGKETFSDGSLSALPFAAYQLIYNEYYRDQNLIPYGGNSEDPFSSNVDSNGGQASLNNGSVTPVTRRLQIAQLRTRAWQHDYFTAALPFAQKGGSVDLPLGGYAPIVHNIPEYDADAIDLITSQSPGLPDAVVPRDEDAPDFFEAESNLLADLSQGTAASINSLRVAMRTQEFLEKQARGGSRYIEQLKVHFGVTSSDKRMQRPEFLGGTRAPVVISEVLQTSSTDETSPQGNMAGHGISGNFGKTIKYFAEEHGYLFAIMSVRPATAYQQGLPRHFSRRSMYDYAWPTFAHIGEQEVLNKEIYFDANDGKNDDTFGYVPRYAEYRYHPSETHGYFRTNMDHWTFTRQFQNRPQLNKDFIECKPRLDAFAVTEPGNQVVWAHIRHKIKVRRTLPRYGTPTL